MKCRKTDIGVISDRQVLKDLRRLSIMFSRLGPGRHRFPEIREFEDPANIFPLPRVCSVGSQSSVLKKVHLEPQERQKIKFLRIAYKFSLETIQ